MPKERDHSLGMASSPPPQDHEVQRKAIAICELETAVLHELKISSYDLAVLKKFFIDQKLFPRLSDQQSIDAKALEFRESYYDDPPTFAHNPRLDTLFETRSDDGIVHGDDFDEFFRDSLDIPTYERREIQGETAKFNALRAVITDVATCQRQQRLKTGREAKGKAKRALVHRVFMTGATLGFFFFLVVVDALVSDLLGFVS